MLFCQACGAQNTDDAKFCNMCGARIAQAGEPGGPLSSAAKPGAPPPQQVTGAGLATAPNAMNNTTSITLAGIGVQSPARTWAILLGGATLFLLVGAGGAWIAMRSSQTPPPTTSSEDEVPAPPDTTPVEIGDPVPSGEDTPDDGVVISGGPRVRGGGSGTRASGGGSSGGGSSGGSTGGTSSGSAGGTHAGSTSPGGGGSAGSGGAGSTGSGSAGSGSAGSGSAGSGSAGSGSAGSGSAGSGGAGSGSAGSGGSGSGSGSETPTGAGSETSTGTGAGTTTTPTRDWGAMGETIAEDEPDLVMDHYSVSVRRFIRNYYAQRAAACFDHESRTTGQTIRGTVVIAFTIGADGHAQNASVSRNTTGNATLGQCLQRNVAAWELPVPPNREPIEMEMPFSR